MSKGEIDMVYKEYYETREYYDMTGKGDVVYRIGRKR
jgi:hypothetical protein